MTVKETWIASLYSQWRSVIARRSRGDPDSFQIDLISSWIASLRSQWRSKELGLLHYCSQWLLVIARRSRGDPDSFQIDLISSWIASLPLAMTVKGIWIAKQPLCGHCFTSFAMMVKGAWWRSLPSTLCLTMRRRTECRPLSKSSTIITGTETSRWLFIDILDRSYLIWSTSFCIIS